MPISGLHGPYILDDANIATAVTRRSPGAYALGRYTAEGFALKWVGRSDIDVAGVLKAHIGTWPHFKFRYFDAPEMAFDKECEIFHDFLAHGLERHTHPVRATGTEWTCPRCGSLSQGDSEARAPAT